MSFLQSLASAFKGGSGKVPLARSFASPWIFAETGSGQSTYEYTRSVRRAWLDNPVAQRAVRLVSEGIAGAPLAPADPRLAKLIQATSAGQSLLETLAAQMLLHGNGYVQIMKDGAGRPVELFALRPERTSIVAGSDGWPTGFTYKVGDQSLTIPLCDDRDLWFDGVLHSSTPGMVPSSVRRSARFEPDSAEVVGALSHDSIDAADLSAGRFDGARVLIGLIDWENDESHVLYRGAIGSVLEESGKFTAELQSRKAELQRDPVPRTVLRSGLHALGSRLHS
jgi:hypothetical protein